ncbi:MAG: LacI family DNA-binding transcriptional regulator [Paracholeplasma sp.]|jgi:LacI family transcriptional regulator|nr:LacI family DNA-binding transcriptional regulator [Paracholeplasma sp.]MDY3195463.1 LacI family DNA-binding transcriptional regulator [Paracholeplasma sp.]
MKRTIYHIATELGLSPGTISKVINKTGNVSEETRKRVLDYIKEVGYVPATSARMLKSKRSYTIGVVFSEDLKIGLEHSFFASILQNFKSYVEKEGYELSFIVTQLGEHKMSYYEWCMNKKVDGVFIVVGEANDDGIIELANKNIPCVSTDIVIPGITSVISDNEDGIIQSLDYLFKDRSLSDVAIITGPLKSRSFYIRYQTYMNYLKTNKLPIKKSYIVEAESFGFTSGVNAANKLIEENPVLPKAILVGSDDIALGVLKSLKEHQIKVPDDIEIIGFDDIPFAKHFTPSLTTVKQDKVMIGETAAKALINMIEHSNQKQEKLIKVPVSLILRESTK